MNLSRGVGFQRDCNWVKQSGKVPEPEMEEMHSCTCVQADSCQYVVSHTFSTDSLAAQPFLNLQIK